MAVIGKIRQRAGLLIIIVGISLVAFILGDLLTSNTPILRGMDTTIGIIGGKKFKIEDFERRVSILEENYKLSTNKDFIDQNTMEQLRNQAWGQLLNDELLGKQYKKSGIHVSAEEIFDMVQGKHVHQQIKDAFKDPQTGEFNPATVIQFLKNMDQDQTGRTRMQWVNFEKAIAQERLSQKYENLVKGGLYVTTAEVKRHVEHQQRQAQIRYIQIPYTSLHDTLFKPTDRELNLYIKSHPNDYKQDHTRKVEYVIFEVVPSSEDWATAKKYVIDHLEAFRTAEDDSAFAAMYADTPPSMTFQKKGTLTYHLDTLMFNSPVGTISNVYEENGYFKAARLSEIVERPDSLKVSHILVAYQGAERSEATRSKEEASARADSLFKLCEKDHKKFLEFARLQSDDKVTAEKEGDLGWITKDSPMDERFKKGAFEISRGQVKVVESNFGFHLIKVMDATQPQKQVRLTYLDKKVEPSDKTYHDWYMKAATFASENRTAEQFDKACSDQGLSKRVLETLKEGEKNIPGLESPQEMVRWAFKAKKGEVSPVFRMENKYVVAKLERIKQKGLAQLEDVRTQVTEAVIKEMKVRKIMEDINGHISKGARSLDDLAARTGYTVQTASGINFISPYIMNIGLEPALAGAIFATEKGQLSKPVKGESGVFIFVVESFNEPAEQNDYSQSKKNQAQNLKARASYEVFNALKEKARVEDLRGRFY